MLSWIAWSKILTFILQSQTTLVHYLRQNHWSQNFAVFLIPSVFGDIVHVCSFEGMEAVPILLVQYRKVGQS